MYYNKNYFVTMLVQIDFWHLFGTDGGCSM